MVSVSIFGDDTLVCATAGKLAFLIGSLATYTLLKAH